MSLVELQKLDKILAEERSHFVAVRLIILLSLFVSVLLLQMLRGGKHYQSVVGIEPCSLADISILCLIYLICISSFMLVVFITRDRHRKKLDCGYQFNSEDLQYDFNSILKLAALGVCGGISGGCLGIGGGMIFNPILMDMGMHPQVASATGMYLVLYSSLSTIVQFTILNMVNYPFALWMCTWSTLGTLTGIYLIGTLVQRSGKTSYILMCLLLLILLSATVLPIQGIVHTLDLQAQGVNVLQFKSLCP